MQVMNALNLTDPFWLKIDNFTPLMAISISLSLSILSCNLRPTIIYTNILCVSVYIYECVHHPWFYSSATDGFVAF